MAQSRLEKIGSIFARITSLRKGGALKADNIPLWYEVYKHFPPKYEPRYDRPIENKEIQPIFYAEDVMRAKFQAEFPEANFTNLHSTFRSKTQEFLSIYKQKEKEGISENDLYATAIKEFQLQHETMQMSKFNESEYSNVQRNKKRGVKISPKLDKDFLSYKEN